MNDKPKFNPQIHHRRSIRLKGYDYSQAGLYFITICCENKICRFGKIVGASLADAQNTNELNSDIHYKNIQNDDIQNLDNIIEKGTTQNLNNINEKGQPQGFAPTEGKMILNDYGKIAFDEWMKLSNRFPNVELDVFQIMPNHIHGIIILKDVGATLAVDQNGDIENKIPINDISERENHNINEGINYNNNEGINYNNKVGANHSNRAGTNHNNRVGTNHNNRAGTNYNNRAGTNYSNRAGTNYSNRAGASPAPTISDIVGAYKSLVSNACLEIFKLRNEMMGKLWQRNYYEHIIRDEQSYQTISNYIICNPMKWEEDKFYM